MNALSWRHVLAVSAKIPVLPIVRTRFLLPGRGRSCAGIAEALYLDDDTVRGWYKCYRAEGWEVLAVDGWRGGHSRLSVTREAGLSQWLRARFCRSATEIRAHVLSEFGLSYSHSGCLRLLARLGFEYRKPRALPRVADGAAQVGLIETYERLMTCLPADEIVYFADAVHPEYQAKPAFGWVCKGSDPAVQTTAGRGRVNIHAAFCLENFDAPFALPVTVDGQNAVQLPEKIQARSLGKSTIHVIWDNAAYHRCDAVRRWLKLPACRMRGIDKPWNIFRWDGQTYAHWQEVGHGR